MPKKSTSHKQSKPKAVRSEAVEPINEEDFPPDLRTIYFVGTEASAAHLQLQADRTELFEKLDDLNKERQNLEYRLLHVNNRIAETEKLISFVA